MPHSQEGQSDIFGALLGGRSNSTKTPADRLAYASLLAANILPILLALTFGWDVGDVVTFYWLENIIIGLWVIPRLITAQGSFLPGPDEVSDQLSRLTGSNNRPTLADPPRSTVEREPESIDKNAGEKTINGQGNLFLVPFFCFHYFFFCLVHGFFVSVFAGGAFTGNTSGPLPFDMPEGGGWPGPLIFFQLFYSLLTGALGGLSTGGLLAVSGLAISHGVSFFRNYIGHGEYKQSYTILEMFRPYPRIVVLHLGIMAGGIATLLLGSPLPLVIVLMIGKTVLDAKLYLAS